MSLLLDMLRDTEEEKESQPFPVKTMKPAFVPQAVPTETSATQSTPHISGLDLVRTPQGAVSIHPVPEESDEDDFERFSFDLEEEDPADTEKTPEMFLAHRETQADPSDTEEDPFQILLDDDTRSDEGPTALQKENAPREHTKHAPTEEASGISSFGFPTLFATMALAPHPAMTVEKPPEPLTGTAGISLAPQPEQTESLLVTLPDKAATPVQPVSSGLDAGLAPAPEPASGTAPESKRTARLFWLLKGGAFLIGGLAVAGYYYQEALNTESPRVPAATRKVPPQNAPTRPAPPQAQKSQTAPAPAPDAPIQEAARQTQKPPTAPGQPPNAPIQEAAHQTQKPPTAPGQPPAAPAQEAAHQTRADAKPPKNGPQPRTLPRSDLSARDASQKRPPSSAPSPDGTMQPLTATGPSTAGPIATEKPASRKPAKPPAAKTSKTAPGSEPEPLQAGRRAFLDNDLATAKARFEQLLSREPHNHGAISGLASVAIREGNPDRARALYQSILKENPHDTLAIAALISLTGNPDPIRTESRLQHLLREKPNEAHLYFALGNVHVEQKNWPEAQNAFFNAYRLDRDNPDILLNLAVSLDQMGQEAAALTHYREALRLMTVRHGAGFDLHGVQRRIAILAQRHPDRP
ncbi:MAG: tetratricopeptide repeat protein [Magnetococcales bacterium]|nr:tetratricopeptide repeat protein [Magnetococcales bacterium]